MRLLPAPPHLTAPHAVAPGLPSPPLVPARASNAPCVALSGRRGGCFSPVRRDIGAGGVWGERGGQGSARSSAGRSWGEGGSTRRGVCRATGKGFGGGQGTGGSAGGAKGEKKDSGASGKKDGGAFGGLDWREVARPAPPMLDLSQPRVYYFALANAYSLMDKGALLEEVLADGIRRSQRGGRARDVWMVMEPVFLDHPSLASLKAAIRPPTAAIVSTNGDWMLTIVHEMLPQATIGKFYAPTPQLPDPLKSKLTPGDVALGGGGIWH
ncbi:hypothetical protein CLOP_g8773 [Closterium sp. NIES-67]|nr:hypothetical protein CLOP_g8773 [Closterium sp. NIES-67]